MKPLFTRKQSRAFDVDAMDRLGVRGLSLMENAGAAACRALVERFDDRLQRVVIVGGTGQNGGDAWVVARHLRALGVNPSCVLVGGASRVAGDAKANLEALASSGIDVLRAEDGLNIIQENLARASLVVDGLFGTGLDRPIDGVFADVVVAINSSPAQVVALDLPSGVDADTGAILGVAVQAQLTMTFAALKRGLTQHPGRGLAGEVVVCGLGVLPPAVGEGAVIEDRDVCDWLVPRVADVHKGAAGRVTIVAGHGGTTGAALLAGRGALRGGAGLVTLAPRGDAFAAVQGKVLEMMLAQASQESCAAYASLCQEASAVVVGPGFGTDQIAHDVLVGLCRDLTMPTVVDADALTAVARLGLGSMRQAAGPRILTPHPGEAARLLGSTVAHVQADRYAAVLNMAQVSGHVVVLKGAGTLVASPSGEIHACSAGTSAMAGAGMGDVLSGLVAACCCTLPPMEAAGAAVHWHARAGERAAAGIDRGLLASELADALPAALSAMRRSCDATRETSLYKG